MCVRTVVSVAVESNAEESHMPVGELTSEGKETPGADQFPEGEGAAEATVSGAVSDSQFPSTQDLFGASS